MSKPFTRQRDQAKFDEKIIKLLRKHGEISFFQLYNYVTGYMNEDLNIRTTSIPILNMTRERAENALSSATCRNIFEIRKDYQKKIDYVRLL